MEVSRLLTITPISTVAIQPSNTGWSPYSIYTRLHKDRQSINTHAAVKHTVDIETCLVILYKLMHQASSALGRGILYSFGATLSRTTSLQPPTPDFGLRSLNNIAYSDAGTNARAMCMSGQMETLACR